MTTAIIHLYDGETPLAEAPVFPRDNELAVLEELLYIEQELTPAQRMWMRDMVCDSKARFTYHNCEDFIVKHIGGHDYRIDRKEN